MVGSVIACHCKFSAENSSEFFLNWSIFGEGMNNSLVSCFWTHGLITDYNIFQVINYHAN